jgi:hypothetical protein
MNGILDDALSALLLLREGIDSNKDSEDHCRTQSSNDSSTTLPFNDSNATHTSDDSSATPTSSLPEKKRKYKKRGRLAVSDDRWIIFLDSTSWHTLLLYNFVNKKLSI